MGIIIYLFLLIVIVGFYLIACLKIRPLLENRIRQSPYVLMGALSAMVIMFLTCCFAWSSLQYNNKIRKEIKSNSHIFESDCATKKAPYIILIVLDTVRADYLPTYGGEGFTPNLEQFSNDSLVFENCIAPSSWTVPSHASLFTGLYPVEHGTLGNSKTKLQAGPFGFPLPPPLAKSFLTLPEVFKASGYFTPALISNSALKDPKYQIIQGFHVLNNFQTVGEQISGLSFRPLLYLFSYLTNFLPKYALRYWNAEELTSESIRLVEKLDRAPFFLFLNYLDAHYPYAPPRPFAGKFVGSSFPQFYRLKQHFHRYMDPAKASAQDTPPYFNEFNLTQYKGAIAYLDAELGKLFAYLKQIDIYDSSLIVVTSDHGELFGEQGLYQHRTNLYDGAVKVPLIMKLPYSKKTGRENQLISLIDLYPTILSICDLPIPDEITGKAFGKGAPFVGAQFYNNEEGSQKSIYNGQYKYMQYERAKAPELYDLEADPLEQVNSAETLPEVVRRLKEKLDEWDQTHGPKYAHDNKTEEFSSENAKALLEALRGLGYVE